MTIKGERQINDARVQELIAERQTATTNNVGMFLARGVLFLNLSDTERREAEALQRRNARLDALMRARACSMT
ncbi:hypothetical protein QMO56_08040 [Roseomonas sp. E05]|uniref:hypothetical protein n=1 Tax=Roseomonas sp. E05 TaxID=3046310 RepID=UPI0024BA7AF2|nr:hypothetical protein [Roseomonas sp. E05]MDJ0388062.1 hypothetical protein [Roseomonas sp. E05]